MSGIGVITALIGPTCLKTQIVERKYRITGFPLVEQPEELMQG